MDTQSLGLGLNGEALPSPIPAEQLSPSQICGEQARRKSRVSEEKSAPNSSPESGDGAEHPPPPAAAPKYVRTCHGGRKGAWGAWKARGDVGPWGWEGGSGWKGNFGEMLKCPRGDLG